jgi:hypothetical protein
MVVLLSGTSSSSRHDGNQLRDRSRVNAQYEEKDDQNGQRDLSQRPDRNDVRG